MRKTAKCLMKYRQARRDEARSKSSKIKFFLQSRARSGGPACLPRDWIKHKRDFSQQVTYVKESALASAIFLLS